MVYEEEEILAGSIFAEGEDDAEETTTADGDGPADSEIDGVEDDLDDDDLVGASFFHAFGCEIDHRAIVRLISKSGGILESA